ncbi:MAG: hypothetical protein ACI4Q4_06740 [Oscillospiraceae bacterium]
MTNTAENLAQFDPEIIAQRTILERTPKQFSLNGKSRCIHHPSCFLAKRISPANLKSAEAPDESARICRRCGNKLLLELGSCESSAPLEEYQRFFERTGLDENGIRALFLGHGAKTCLISDSSLMLHIREDFWKLIIMENDSLLVMHNNYTRYGDKRVFCEGFHPQAAPIAGNPQRAFRLMTSYSWSAHMTASKPRGRIRVVEDSAHGDILCERPSDIRKELRRKMLEKQAQNAAAKRKKQHNAASIAAEFIVDASEKTDFTEQPAPEEKRSSAPPAWDDVPVTYYSPKKKKKKKSKRASRNGFEFSAASDAPLGALAVPAQGFVPQPAMLHPAPPLWEEA